MAVVCMFPRFVVTDVLSVARLTHSPRFSGLWLSSLCDSGTIWRRDTFRSLQRQLEGSI
ncbi:hypothetical protein NOVOSPHI9U_70246 [Novosphingobium sp. 9U]|nr:hypothetical protein NOVOSPHI9U_70246 [Novosphingobium sp. 9U]